MNLRMQQKQASRQRLLDTAAEYFRRNGYGNTGLSDITTGAGLTNGAFYAHFKSKLQLLQQMLKRACEQTRAYWYGQDGNNRNQQPEQWLQQAIDHYLSTEHRDLAELGCVVPTLAAEVARQNKATRRCFENEVGKNIAPMQDHLQALGEQDQHSAWGLLAVMAGGVMLSRAVADPVLSENILAASRRMAHEHVAQLNNPRA